MVSKVNRPHIIINCAMSADGKIALPNRKQLRISSDDDMKRVYQLRNSCDAVLVGMGSVLSDDPKLTVKQSYVKNPRQPVRIVMDSWCNTPTNALVVNDTAKTIICCVQNKGQTIYGTHVEILKCKQNKQQTIDISDMLDKLYQKGIKTMLVEGGGTIIWNFLKNRLVDDIYVYIGPLIIGGTQTPTMADGNGIQSADEVIPLILTEIQHMKEGVLLHYQLKD